MECLCQLLKTVGKNRRRYRWECYVSLFRNRWPSWYEQRERRTSFTPPCLQGWPLVNDRNFLLDLHNNPASTKKPVGLHNLEIVRDKIICREYNAFHDDCIFLFIDFRRDRTERSHRGFFIGRDFALPCLQRYATYESYRAKFFLLLNLVFRPLWRPLFVLHRTGYGRTFRIRSIFQLTKSRLFKLIPADTVFDGIVVGMIVPEVELEKVVMSSKPS